MVVVLGVLVALAVQSSYQGWQNQRMERAYLLQLERDLAATAGALRAAIHEDSVRLAATGELVTAMRATGAPSFDRARQWLGHAGGAYSDPRPVLGTVGTLLQTGDIGLIQDASLRSRIVAYADYMASDLGELNRNIDRMVRANDSERLQLARIGHHQEWPSTDAELSAYFREYRADWNRLRGDPDLYAAYLQRGAAYVNRLGYMRRMLAATDELRALVVRADRTTRPDS